MPTTYPLDTNTVNISQSQYKRETPAVAPRTSEKSTPNAFSVRKTNATDSLRQALTQGFHDVLYKSAALTAIVQEHYTLSVSRRPTGLVRPVH